MPEVGKTVYFATPERWRAWLEKHHATRDELWVGFYKRDTGRPSITWPESVDEALCYGWIDGIRKSLGTDAYVIRFTRRRPGSIWSAVNTRRVAALKKEGRMMPAGLEAFGGKVQAKSGIYAFEQDRKKARLPAKYQQIFKKNAKAWAFYQTYPDWYRRQTAWLVASAKQEETRLRRLARVIANAAAGKSADELRREAFPGASRSL